MIQQLLYSLSIYCVAYYNTLFLLIIIAAWRPPNNNNKSEKNYIEEILKNSSIEVKLVQAPSNGKIILPSRPSSAFNQPDSILGLEADKRLHRIEHLAQNNFMDSLSRPQDSFQPSHSDVVSKLIPMLQKFQQNSNLSFKMEPAPETKPDISHNYANGYAKSSDSNSNSDKVSEEGPAYSASTSEGGEDSEQITVNVDPSFAHFDDDYSNAEPVKDDLTSFTDKLAQFQRIRAILSQQKQL